jgi:hypothetical protein
MRALRLRPRTGALLTPALALWATLALAPAALGALPDGRAYELISRYTQAGREVGLNGEIPDFAAAATAGEAVDWEGVGGCCGAGSGAVNLYRSQRTAEGWQTEALTPTPSQPLSGLSEGQQPVFFSGDLGETVFETPVAYHAGAERPSGSHAEDLYLREPDGALTWLSQGPKGTGSGPYSAEFDAATPDAGAVVFSSAESLAEKAEGLKELNYPPQYLYLRSLSTKATTLVDVNEADELISLYGAILGNGGWLKEELIPANYQGTTTHALSDDATKIFFESPPPRTELEGAGTPHLYMRELTDKPTEDKTVEIDDASSSGEARYEGASADGSLVFFTSNEGLAGASTANELYEFNTTSTPVDEQTVGSPVPIGGDSGVLGVTAIANDGSSVYFVATNELAGANLLGAEAEPGEPNLYRYETATGLTTFIATLAWPDVSQCDPDCGRGHPANLVAEPDTTRPAYPTPDGSVLAFSSYGDLTGQAGGARTELTAEAITGEHTLAVASTAGFEADQRISIGNGADEELDTIQSVEPSPAPGEPGHLTLDEYGPDSLDGLSDDHPAGEPVVQLHSEVYRYSASENALTCLSCVPGVTPAGNATLGPAGGGSYAPPGKPVPLSEDGSRVFFESSDPLLPGVTAAPASVSDPPNNVYEWEHGQLHLISDGSSAGFHLDGTTLTGDEVFITTHAQLTAPANERGEHPTGGEADIYDARVGGGFPEEPHGCNEETCRPTTAGGIPAFTSPQSAVLGAAGFEEGAPAVPTVALGPIYSAQRHALARTGHLALAVHTSAPDILIALVTARIAGRTITVARATARLARAGTAVLALSLDALARRTLAHTGALALRLTLTSSAGAPPQTITFALRRATRAHHAAATRSPRV